MVMGEHGERVGLASGRASSTPDTQAFAWKHQVSACQAGEQLALEIVVVAFVAKEARHIGREQVEEHQHVFVGRVRLEVRQIRCDVIKWRLA